MMWNETSLSRWRLYVVIDRAAVGDRDLTQVGEAAIRGGADVVQLRDKRAPTAVLLKEARQLLRVTRPANVPLLINDRVDVALAADADGVHLGQEDLPTTAARAVLGPGRIIGRSTHSLEQARAADDEAPDYIAVGPIFSTPTKPDYPQVGTGLITEALGHVKRPIVAIGGINEATLGEVTAAGARCVAVVRAVAGAADVEQAARRLKQAMIASCERQAV